MKAGLGRQERREIDELVQYYSDNISVFSQFVEIVRIRFAGHKELASYVHSMKWRVKDPDHLKDKLIRKRLSTKANGQSFDINKINLFEQITDLAGFRILHLYTRQMECINGLIIGLLQDAQWPLIEGPEARTWDDESRRYFQSIGIATIKSDTMYTSVHYVFQQNSRVPLRCELQVRTLMEEVWGEVDHTINYPTPSSNTSCREQIRALARLTSGCTRLVDSIFLSHDEHVSLSSGSGRARRKK